MNIQYHEMPDGKMVRVACKPNTFDLKEPSTKDRYFYPLEFEVPPNEKPAETVQRYLKAFKGQPINIEKVIVTYRADKFEDTRILSITGGTDIELDLTPTE